MMRAVVPSVLAAALALSGCSSLIGGSTDRHPPFEECQADAYAFAGEATLAQLDLGHLAEPEAALVGMVWVTNEPVAGAPRDLPANVPLPPLSRMVCVEWPDGSGMTAPIEDSWQPPDGTDATDAAPPWLALAVAAGLLGAVVLTVVAFRSDGPRPA